MIRFIGNGHLLINYSHSPWGSWASDNGAFSQPPFPPPLIITLGPIPSLLVISLVVSGFSSFRFCVLAGDSDLCCSALATGIFITTNPLYVFLVFQSCNTIDDPDMYDCIIYHLTTFTDNLKKNHLSYIFLSSILSY